MSEAPSQEPRRLSIEIEQSIEEPTYAELKSSSEQGRVHSAGFQAEQQKSLEDSMEVQVPLEMRKDYYQSGEYETVEEAELPPVIGMGEPKSPLEGSRPKRQQAPPVVQVVQADTTDSLLSGFVLGGATAAFLILALAVTYQVWFAEDGSPSEKNERVVIKDAVQIAPALQIPPAPRDTPMGEEELPADLVAPEPEGEEPEAGPQTIDLAQGSRPRAPSSSAQVIPSSPPVYSSAPSTASRNSAPATNSAPSSMPSGEELSDYSIDVPEF